VPHCDHDPARRTWDSRLTTSSPVRSPLKRPDPEGLFCAVPSPLGNHTMARLRIKPATLPGASHPGSTTAPSPASLHMNWLRR